MPAAPLPLGRLILVTPDDSVTLLHPYSGAAEEESTLDDLSRRLAGGDGVVVRRLVTALRGDPGRFRSSEVSSSPFEQRVRHVEISGPYPVTAGGRGANEGAVVLFVRDVTARVERTRRLEREAASRRDAGRNGDASTRAEAPLSDPAAPSGRPGAAGRGRVLVVDDNVDFADALRAVLRADGYDVEVAFDGGSALALASTRRPDVVLLDIGLPVTDGYEVARLLREADDTPLLVAVTGYDPPPEKKSLFDHVFVKPAVADAIMRFLGDSAASKPGGR